MSGESHTPAVRAGISVLKEWPGNKRGRPGQGVVSRLGLTMYPVADMANTDDTRYLQEPQDFKSKDPLGEPANMRAFRNISQSLFHSPNPVSDRSSAMLSLERKFGKGAPSVVAVANALPIQNPRVAIDEGKQREAFHGSMRRDENKQPIEGNHAERFTRPFGGKRSRHLWTQGNLDQQLMLDLMQGRTNLGDLGFNVGRTWQGDIALFNEQGFEMPRLGYSVFSQDEEGRREYREDTGMPWREARDYQVTGSVDPLLMIPSPDYQSGYIEHEGKPGVPVPQSMSMDEKKHGIDQGLATGRYGLYFNPDDLTPEGQRVYDKALSGDIIRADEASAIFEDAWSVIKYDRPDPLKPLASIMGVKNLTDLAKPYKRQYQTAYTPLLEEGYTLAEPFMGGGGITYGLQPESHIGSDISREMTGLHNAVKFRPEIFSPQALQDMVLTRVGETPTYSAYKGGKETPVTPVGGPVTQEEIEQYGLPDLDGVYYGINYYRQQDRFNRLKDKRDTVGLTDEEEVELLRITWFLAKNAYSQSFRYNKAGYMNMPGPRPKSNKPRGFAATIEDIINSGKVNRERFGLSENDLDIWDYNAQGKLGTVRPDWAKSPQGKPDWMGANTLKQPAYYASGSFPYGITPEESDFSQYQQALRGSNILNMGVRDLISQKRMPPKFALAMDPPYRGQEGQHLGWTSDDSDMIGRVFQTMAKRGIPVTWHDSAHPENLRFVEDSEGGQFGIAGRREGNLKAKTKNVPEMFAFANIDSLDPDEVSSWANSRGAWNP